MTSVTRPPLTPDRLVEAALALAAREGSSSLTLRRLAAELDVDHTSLYRHFKSKDDLFRAVGDHMLSEALESYEPVGDWCDNLHAICRRVYAAFVAVPTLTASLAASPPGGPGEFRMTELILNELIAGGYTDRDLALAYHALLDHVMGVATVMAPYEGIDEHVEAMYEQIRSRYRGLSPAAYPATATVVEHLYRDTEEEFEHALELLLNGLRATAARQTATRVEPRGTANTKGKTP